MVEFEWEFRLRDDSAIRFKSVEKIERWLEGELLAWEWLGQDQHRGASQFSTIQQNLRSATQYTKSVRQNPVDENLKIELKNRLNSIQAMLRSGQFWPSSSDFGKFLIGLSKESVGVAADVLSVANISRAKGVSNDAGSGKALTLFTIYEHGLGKFSLASSRKTVNELTSKINELIQDFENEAEVRLKDLDDRILKREEKVEQSTTGLARLLNSFKRNTRQEQFELRGDAKTRLESLLEDSGRRLSEFEEFYETKVALLEPVSYWRSKKKWHIGGTVVSAAIFFGYCSVLAFFIGKFIFQFEGGVMGFIDFWKARQFASLSAIALLLAMLLIVARIFYRIFASQLHLWNDASERVTMTQTYLALAERGHVKDEHLSTVLNRLFAPASDGVVKDDFGSVTPVDALLGRLQK